MCNLLSVRERVQLNVKVSSAIHWKVVIHVKPSVFWSQTTDCDGYKKNFQIRSLDKNKLECLRKCNILMEKIFIVIWKIVDYVLEIKRDVKRLWMQSSQS